MSGSRFFSLCWCVTAWVCLFSVGVRGEEKPKPQYAFNDIVVPAARADEPKLKSVSVERALEYLDKGTTAWNGERRCVTCHTNGTYMVTRPALTPQVGKPSESARTFLVSALKQKLATDRDKLLPGVQPAQVIYIAAGLAEWDAHVSKKLSPETEQALALMFAIQQKTGTWGTADCSPPYESDAYHEATVAAMAAATAPGWLADLKDPKLQSAVDRLRNYLRTEKPPHDYGRVLLLWAAMRMPDLLDNAKKQELVEMIWRHQRPDGGWSIRTFAAPEAWGKGNRAAKLRKEPEFADPPSDGHQTGLAILVLREAGVEARDPRIQRGLHWLLANQRESGRWWTRSLNTDTFHFITYSGTAFPLLALAKCAALPKN